MKNKLFLFFITLSLISIKANAQLFYKIEGNNIEKPSYIFGSHHMAPVSVAENNHVFEHFDEIDQVIGEIDLTRDLTAVALASQKYMMAPEDSTLSKLYSPEDFSRLNEEFKKWAPTPGMDLKMIEIFKPMVISTMVTATMIGESLPEYNIGEVIDKYIQDYGVKEGKNICPLETTEFQAEILYGSVPISIQAEMLSELLDNPAETLTSTEKLNKAYMEGNLEALLELSQEDNSHPEFMNTLLEKRNSDWLVKLPEMISDQPALIVVGALHLAGENGILEGLRKQGYTVTPM